MSASLWWFGDNMGPVDGAIAFSKFIWCILCPEHDQAGTVFQHIFIIKNIAVLFLGFRQF